MVSSLELLPKTFKIEISEFLLENINHIKGNSKDIAYIFSRLGTRELFYGNPSHIIPPENISLWIKYLIEIETDIFNSQPIYLAMIIRKTGDRSIDLEPPIFKSAMKFLKQTGANDEILKIAEGKLSPNNELQQVVVGDSLPFGLSDT